MDSKKYFNWIKVELSYIRINGTKIKLGQRTFLALNAYAAKMLKIYGKYPSEDNRKQNKSSKVEEKK